MRYPQATHVKQMSKEDGRRRKRNKRFALKSQIRTISSTGFRLIRIVGIRVCARCAFVALRARNGRNTIWTSSKIEGINGTEKNAAVDGGGGDDAEEKTHTHTHMISLIFADRSFNSN